MVGLLLRRRYSFSITAGTAGTTGFFVSRVGESGLTIYIFVLGSAELSARVYSQSFPKCSLGAGQDKMVLETRIYFTRWQVTLAWLMRDFVMEMRRGMANPLSRSRGRFLLGLEALEKDDLSYMIFTSGGYWEAQNYVLIGTPRVWRVLLGLFTIHLVTPLSEL